MRAEPADTARLRAISGRLPLIRLWSGPQTPSPEGEGFSVRVGFGQWQGSLPPPPAGGTAPLLAQAPPPPCRGSLSRRGRQDPLGPLCEGAPPAGGGGENCAVARNISGSDCQKHVFLPCCVCRGDHWSPASLPPQRIFRDSFLARQTGTGEQCSPLQECFYML